MDAMDDHTTERSFVSQATWVIDMLGLFLDMFSIAVCSTRHWHTFGRLVQELNACTILKVLAKNITEELRIKPLSLPLTVAQKDL